MYKSSKFDSPFLNPFLNVICIKNDSATSTKKCCAFVKSSLETCQNVYYKFKCFAERYKVLCARIKTSLIQSFI